MTVKNWIREFADENPTFTSAGYECPPGRFAEWRAELFTPGFEHMVCTAVIAFTDRPPKAYPWSIAKNSSYWLKHAVEQWVKENPNPYYATYIRNGAVIVALASLFYEPKRRWLDGPNCEFKKKAPALWRPGR